MEKFTVIGCNDTTGEIRCCHVVAANILNSFASAAALDGRLRFSVAMPGWLQEGEQIEFCGEAEVLVETVLEQEDVFGRPAYRLSTGDIETVLAEYSLRVTDTKGKSFATMAEELIDELDEGRIVGAAMATGSSKSEDLIQAGLDAIKEQLVELGILEF